MKKITWCLLISFTLMTLGCTYAENYRAYAVAQSSMAAASGPLVEFGCDGKIKSIGNPMMAYAMLSMKPPKDAWEYAFDALKIIAPFGFIWGIVGSMANMNQGTTTNVSGSGNYTGNTGGSGSLWNSPTTTTTTTTLTEIPAE